MGSGGRRPVRIFPGVRRGAAHPDVDLDRWRAAHGPLYLRACRREVGGGERTDPISLLDAAERLMRRLGPELGAAARRRAGQYNWGRSIDRMLALHQRLADGAPYRSLQGFVRGGVRRFVAVLGDPGPVGEAGLCVIAPKFLFHRTETFASHNTRTVQPRQRWSCFKPNTSLARPASARHAISRSDSRFAKPR